MSFLSKTSIRLFCAILILSMCAAMFPQIALASGGLNGTPNLHASVTGNPVRIVTVWGFHLFANSDYRVMVRPMNSSQGLQQTGVIHTDALGSFSGVYYIPKLMNKPSVHAYQICLVDVIRAFRVCVAAGAH